MGFSVDAAAATGRLPLAFSAAAPACCAGGLSASLSCSTSCTAHSGLITMGLGLTRPMSRTLTRLLPLLPELPEEPLVLEQDEVEVCDSSARALSSRELMMLMHSVSSIDKVLGVCGVELPTEAGLELVRLSARVSSSSVDAGVPL